MNRHFAATVEDVADSIISLDGSDLERCRKRFIDSVRDRPHLIAQIFDEHTIRSRAGRWFEDYVNEKLRAQGQAVYADGQSTSAERLEHHSDDGEGQSTGAEQATESELSSVVDQDPSGQGSVADMASQAEPDGPVDGGHATRAAEAAIIAAPPVYRPQSAASIAAAAEVAHHLTRSVFNTFRLRNGMAIGDVRLGDLEAIRAANAKEAAVIRQVQKRAATCPPGMLVREAISSADLETFIANAERVAHAT